MGNSTHPAAGSDTVAAGVPVIGPLQPCLRVAVVRIEAYRPAAGMMHGSLDWAAYACRAHGRQMLARVQAGVNVEHGRYGNGFWMDVEPGRQRCGDVFDYARRRLQA